MGDDSHEADPSSKGHLDFRSQSVFCFLACPSLTTAFAAGRREVHSMNQKPNSLTIDINVHFEGSLELKSMIRWLVPIAFALIQLAIRVYHGS